MKKIILLLLLTACTLSAHAVYVKSMPVNRIQPNGDTIHFFVTGDEYYHRYHDADNYTIVMNADGYWVYALPAPTGGIQPSDYTVGSIVPASLGIQPGLVITRQEWETLHKVWEIPEQYRKPTPKTSGRNHGDYCNLVIFIRFADDSNYSRSLNSIDRMFSDSSRDNSNSVYNFFKHITYNKLHVRTHYAPAPDGDIIRSYQSVHPRSYYMPYSADNPDGYRESEHASREFDLLCNAVAWINANYPVPDSVILDNDGDGEIDNVNFVVRGSYTGWSDLLWPHKWNLYGRNANINGKHINTFNFALEGAGGDYFGTSTFCHEMFHSLGAPDLYHYYTEKDITPAGGWDLMHSNSNPPQHPSAFMKWRYGNWLDSIPTLSTPGSYSIYSLADSAGTNNCYKIPTSDPNQYFVLEYRDNEETFETALPGKGLLIWRIDDRFDGNAGYDGYNNLDGVWLMRPGSTNRHENGYIGMAAFDNRLNRPDFTPGTDPYPYLQDGTRELSFSITNIHQTGTRMSFYFTNRTSPVNLTYSSSTSASVNLSWLGMGDAYRVSYVEQNCDCEPTTRIVHNDHITLSGLNPNTIYDWNVTALFNPNGDGTYSDSSRVSANATFHTELCNFTVIDTITDNSYSQATAAPFVNNANYNYSQQIYSAQEVGAAQNISTIRFHYAHTTPLSKTNCTIYLANTQRDHFNRNDTLLPLDSLTMVFAGDMYFTRGWNEFVLNTPFHHNGTDNLVVAIDDNSGTPSRIGEKFYVNNTDYVYKNIVYSATESNKNPGPEQDSITGSRSMNFYRNDLQFVGCPDLPGQAYICVISDNEDAGYVLGSSLHPIGDTATIYAFPNNGYTFREWNDGITINPRGLHVTQDTLFIAYFNAPVGIRDVEDGDLDGDGRAGGYIVATQGLTLTVRGAEHQRVAVYDLMGRRIDAVNDSHSNPVTLCVPAEGVYILRVGNAQPQKLLLR